VVFHKSTDDDPHILLAWQTALMNPLETRIPALVALLLLVSYLVWQPPGLAAHAAVRSLGAGTVIEPLAPPLVLVRGFRAPLTEYGAGHRGVDFLARDTASVFAPTDGQISYSGLVATKPVVTVIEANGLRLSMEPVCTLLPAGTRVTSGTSIGSVCGNGYLSHCAPALCLHFSARNDSGYLSPLYLMGQAGPSRLVR